MADSQGLRRRLARTLVLQAVAIGVAACLGVLASALTIENLLIKQALEDEASYFWQLKAADPLTPAPDTRNLTGFLANSDDRASIPEDLRNLRPGFHSLPSQADLTVVNVTARGDEILVLVFEGAQVRELSVLFGLVPLTLVLIVVYIGAFWSYRTTRRAVSPVEWLAGEVSRLDPERPDPDAFLLTNLRVPPDREVVDLAQALERLTQRINALVDRERNFTRDASHELRSPLTVIHMAIDMLRAEERLSPSAEKSIGRIKRAATDMVELVEAFLLLARESELGIEFEPICVNDVVQGEVDRVRITTEGRPVTVVMTAETRMLVETSTRVLSSVVGNLLRNAVDYTEAGEVRVHIGRGFVEITDNGQGMDTHEVDRAFEAFFRGRTVGRSGSTGHGVGLAIVRRLSARFNWNVRIKSERGEGTRVVVEFPDARPV
jgi:signal transduction histidine kinase